jgi:hypothetical protein
MPWRPGRRLPIEGGHRSSAWRPWLLAFGALALIAITECVARMLIDVTPEPPSWPVDPPRHLPFLP